VAASTARHETRALLRAHLAAAMNYRHRTEHCPICRRLLLLAMEPEDEHGTTLAPASTAIPPAAPSGGSSDGFTDGPTGACTAVPASPRAEPGSERSGTQDESPPVP
jgi:hypothetical protein